MAGTAEGLIFDKVVETLATQASIPVMCQWSSLHLHTAPPLPLHDSSSQSFRSPLLFAAICATVLTINANAVRAADFPAADIGVVDRGGVVGRGVDGAQRQASALLTGCLPKCVVQWLAGCQLPVTSSAGRGKTAKARRGLSSSATARAMQSSFRSSSSLTLLQSPLPPDTGCWIRDGC